MEQQTIKSGDAIKFVDENRREHDALITCVHSQSCINLVYVTKDELKSDPYGQQIERMTSVMNKEQNSFGNYWKRLDQV
jgi:hypothetical protein